MKLISNDIEKTNNGCKKRKISTINSDVDYIILYNHSFKI